MVGRVKGPDALTFIVSIRLPYSPPSPSVALAKEGFPLLKYEFAALKLLRA